MIRTGIVSASDRRYNPLPCPRGDIARFRWYPEAGPPELAASRSRPGRMASTRVRIDICSIHSFPRPLLSSAASCPASDRRLYIRGADAYACVLHSRPGGASDWERERRVERPRAMIAEEPPAKRQKTAPSGEAPMPRSRMLRQTLFAVMFLVRM